MRILVNTAIVFGILGGAQLIWDGFLPEAITLLALTLYLAWYKWKEQINEAD